MKFNLLTEAFITNETISNQRLLTAEEIDKLIALSGNVLTFSGNNINLFFDLGNQRAIDYLSYSFTPISASGISILYGRESTNLISGSLVIVGNEIQVTPTASGYSSPRYFKLTHSGVTSITLSGLSIFNSDIEVDFGEDGNLDSTTITAPGLGGYSQVIEIPVVNSGTLDSDIYVCLDTFNTSYDDLSRFEIAPTATGNFSAINTELTIPSGLPWEWGLFEKTKVTNDNKLCFSDPSLSSYTYIVGNEYARIDSVSDDMPAIASETKLPNGGLGIVRPKTSTLNPILIDVANNSYITGNPPTISGTVSETNFQYAWDGDDRLYYLPGDATRNIYYYKISTNTHHTLTTVSFYNRATRCVVCCSGYLYVGGGRSTAGTSTDAGNQFWKINLTTLTATQLFGYPLGNFSPSYHALRYLDGYIYAPRFGLNAETFFYRFNTASETWEAVAYPTGIDNMDLNRYTVNQQLNEVWFISDSLPPKTVYVYSTLLNLFTRTFSLACTYAVSSTSIGFEVAANSSFLYYFNIGYTKTGMLVFNKIPLIFPTAVSGNWISPVIKINTNENYYKALIDYIDDADIDLKFDSSIGSDNFQIRGSNTSPAAQNITHDYTDLNDDDYYIRELNAGSTLSGITDPKELIFDHVYIDSSATPYTSSFLMFNYPLSTTGKMQYKFWWNPATNRQSGSTKYSAFYITPFTDIANAGVLPIRNEDTYERTENNYIRLRLGSQSTDSGGTITRLSLYNGSTSTAYNITAYAGNYYEIILLIDWDQCTYQVYFNGSSLGSGTIPFSTKNLIGSDHSYEFFSIREGVTAREKIKFLTVNRLSNTISDDYNNIGIPVHLNDPLYGKNGSLPWYPVTINSSLIPQYKYLQFKFTLKAYQLYEDLFRINSICFPIVLRLENVPAGDSKSVFIRYNFIPSNNQVTKQLYLKAWMFNDKV